MRISKVPTTVITGFLGAGKTTLVNHVLEAMRPMRIGIVVNEFGEVGIDGAMIVAEEAAIVEISNGCVCCTVRTDLVTSVLALLERFGEGLEQLIVETSGLADPAPVLQTFLADPDMRERVELNAVVVVVDACHALSQLGDDIAREQIVFADRIVVNKVETATPRQIESLQASLRQLNPTATLELATHAQIDVAALLAAKTFSVDHLVAIEPDILDDGTHEHEHDASIQSCGFVISGALDALRFNRWANQLVQTQGASLLRMKGVLNLDGESRRLHFHSVHMLTDTHFGKAWARGELRESRFVAIGRGLDQQALRTALLDCVAVQPQPAAQAALS